MLLVLIGVIIGFYVLYLILMTVLEHSGIIEELQEIKALLKEIRDEMYVEKTNKEEEKKLNSEAYQDKMAEGIAQGILRYIDSKHK